MWYISLAGTRTLFGVFFVALTARNLSYASVTLLPGSPESYILPRGLDVGAKMEGGKRGEEGVLRHALRQWEAVCVTSGMRTHLSFHPHRSTASGALTRPLIDSWALPAFSRFPLLPAPTVSSGCCTTFAWLSCASVFALRASFGNLPCTRRVGGRPANNRE